MLAFGRQLMLNASLHAMPWQCIFALYVYRTITMLRSDLDVYQMHNRGEYRREEEKYPAKALNTNRQMILPFPMFQIEVERNSFKFSFEHVQQR
jgi:hypothetical protein